MVHVLGDLPRHRVQRDQVGVIDLFVDVLVIYLCASPVRRSEHFLPLVLMFEESIACNFVL